MKQVLLTIVGLAVIGCTTFLGESLKGTESMNRQLNQQNQTYGSFTKDELQSGAIVLNIIGIIYFAGIIYILYQRFINAIIEDQVFMIDSDNEVLRPVAYCVLSGCLFVLVCLQSLFQKKQNLGVTSIISSDFFNFLFLFGLIVRKYYMNQSLDSWVFIRDGVFYMVGVSIIIAFYLNRQFDWYIGFILVIYYFLYYFSISKNEQLKETCLKLVGIINEDDDFNSDEHFLYKQRRYSITQLMRSDCILETDEALSGKINRQSALIRINLKDTPEKYHVYFNFQRLVIKVMYGIRNSVKNEKKSRYEFITNIFNKDKKTSKKNTGNLDLGFYQIKEQVNNSEDVINNMESENKLDVNNPKHDTQNNGKLQEKMNSPIMINNSEQLSNYENACQDEERQLFVSKYPQNQNGLKKLIWVTYYPVIFIIGFFPDHNKQPNIKKLIFSTLINGILLFVLSYFIVLWTIYVNVALGIHISLLGSVFLGIILNIPFSIYNLNLARIDKEIDFMQSFMQLAIYKIGIGIGITWIFGYFFINSKEMGFKDDEQVKYGYSMIVLLGIYFVSMLVVISQKFKLTRLVFIIYTVLWVLSLVAVVIIILI